MTAVTNMIDQESPSGPASPAVEPGTPDLISIQRELREVQLLFTLACALNSTTDLSEALSLVLRKLAEHMGLIRGTLTILNRETSAIEIALAYGLSNEEMARGRYGLGEGVTGKVVETGIPAIIERVSQEPAFLDRTGARLRELRRQKDISFVCVPVSMASETIGALSADRYFSPGLSLEEDVRLLTIVATLIAQAVEARRQSWEREQVLREETERLQGEILDHFKPASLVGSSHAIRQVFRMINQVAPTNATVLIRGESGVGKELVAEAIHLNSPRAGMPFIKVNLAALPESLMESELFGHERGAFTGATTQRKGRFETAQGGTLFLDEVGDLPQPVQVKLLRVLQEKEFERVGSSTTQKVDVRLISATNRNLEELIERGQFRMDLYYRLNLFPICVPPLRDRKTDIIELANYFVEKASAKHHKTIKGIVAPAVDMLMSYHWPGNVRELENCIERATLLSQDGMLHGHHLPPSIQATVTGTTEAPGTLPACLAALEYEMITEALRASKGNRAEAARQLGISERVMGLRIKALGIDVIRYK